MKNRLIRRLAAVAACLTLLFTLSSCTDWEDASYITYTCPAPLRLVTSETVANGQAADVLEAVGLTEEDALNALRDGQVIFTSFLPAEDANAENKYPVEIFMTAATEMYVRNVFNFNFLTEEQRDELFRQLTEPTGEKEGYEIGETGVAEHADIYWIRYTYSHTEGTFKQYVAQYTTMYNGFSYTLSAVSADPLDDRALAAMDALLDTVAFTKTLDPVYEYVPQMTFGDTFSRFLNENWLVMLIVALVTVGATSGIMVYYNYRKKHGDKRKNDGVVRAEYLK